MKKQRLKKLKQVEAGEWVKPRMKNYFLQCCDCNLIHRMNFRIEIDKTGKAFVRFQAFRAKKVSR